ncbi:hypothetical protein C2E23DRAFT_149890 [Lenzites betulinus]|nr:hypothetical protein C2E23DRAFT_149890 [Lenzites betulinus]
MDKLAFELLTSIFLLACTDGGYTACSLSRVCKHIREVSRPLRYHTVVLLGDPNKLYAFLVQLEDERASLGPDAAQVRHLFLSTKNVEWEDDILEREAAMAAISLSIDDAGAEHEPRGPSPQPEAEAQRTAPPHTRLGYMSLVSAILRAAAPTLETLVFLPHVFAPPIDSGIVFPVLRELTLDTPYIDIPQGVDMPDYNNSGTLRYPALTRLHLLTGDINAKNWAYHAPDLTHIRVDGRHYRAVCEDLELIYGDPESAYAVRRFKKLQKVIIQVTPPPSKDFCGGVTYIWYEGMVDHLWRTQVVANVPVYILPPESNKTLDERLDRYLPTEEGPWYHRLLKEWEDRLHGGIGCWEAQEEFARAAFGVDDPPPHYLAPWLQSA